MFSGTIKCNDSSYTNHIPIIYQSSNVIIFWLCQDLDSQRQLLAFCQKTARPTQRDRTRRTRKRPAHGRPMGGRGSTFFVVANRHGHRKFPTDLPSYRMVDLSIVFCMFTGYLPWNIYKLLTLTHYKSEPAKYLKKYPHQDTIWFPHLARGTLVWTTPKSGKPMWCSYVLPPNQWKCHRSRKTSGNHGTYRVYFPGCSNVFQDETSHFCTQAPELEMVSRSCWPLDFKQPGAMKEGGHQRRWWY